MRPPVFRGICGVSYLRVVLILAIVFELASLAFPQAARVYREHVAAVLPGALAMLTNEERVRQQVPSLRPDTLLSAAALLKAQDMANRGYFAHVSPEGKEPWYWLDQVGYQYDYAGENLAMNFSDSEEVTAAWMNSPSHRANIVKSEYTEVGTGVATGTYDGRKALFVAQVYANPRAGWERPVEPAAPDYTGFAVETSAEEATVLGTSTVYRGDTASSLFERAAAAPQKAALSVGLGIILFSALYLILRRIDRTRPALITASMTLLALILGALVVYVYEMQEPEQISIDYTYEEVR